MEFALSHVVFEAHADEVAHLDAEIDLGPLDAGNALEGHGFPAAGSAQQGQDLVTLITCTPYGINSHRLLVRGHRVPYTPEAEAQAVATQKPGWFQSLPMQYRHLLIGLLVVVGIVALRLLIGALMRRSRKRRKREHEK